MSSTRLINQELIFIQANQLLLHSLNQAHQLQNFNSMNKIIDRELDAIITTVHDFINVFSSVPKNEVTIQAFSVFAMDVSDCIGDYIRIRFGQINTDPYIVSIHTIPTLSLSSSQFSLFPISALSIQQSPIADHEQQQNSLMDLQGNRNQPKK